MATARLFEAIYVTFYLFWICTRGKCVQNR